MILNPYFLGKYTTCPSDQDSHHIAAEQLTDVSSDIHQIPSNEEQEERLVYNCRVGLQSDQTAKLQFLS